MKLFVGNFDTNPLKFFISLILMVKLCSTSSDRKGNINTATPVPLSLWWWNIVRTSASIECVCVGVHHMHFICVNIRFRVACVCWTNSDFIRFAGVIRKWNRNFWRTKKKSTEKNMNENNNICLLYCQKRRPQCIKTARSISWKWMNVESIIMTKLKSRFLLSFAILVWLLFPMHFHWIFTTTH